MKATTTIDECVSFGTSPFTMPGAQSRWPEPGAGAIGRILSRFSQEGNVRAFDAAAAYQSETVSEESGFGGEWIPLQRLANTSEELGGMVGRSGLIRGVFSAVERLGPYKATVLIQGESGTGKELVARALHNLGPSPQGPFVTFNCSNLVDSLAESQLFGHVRGAFTDARDEALGYFRSANGGTLLLDEVGELPLRLQAKLLRSVESYEIQPVGSARSYHVDIRLVAATNRDLLAMVKAGQFRDDLYYRLNATAIFIPPLRRRIEDLDVLAAHFIERYNRLLGKRVEYLSRRALTVLARHDWPGNVREFAHALESAMMLTAGNRIDVHDLPALLLESGPAAEAAFSPDIAPEMIWEDRPALKPNGKWASFVEEPKKANGDSVKVADGPPKRIVITLLTTGDAPGDKLLLRRVYDTLISHPGDDHFTLIVTETDGRQFAMDFFNDLTTHYCDELVEQLSKFVPADVIKVQALT